MSEPYDIADRLREMAEYLHDEGFRRDEDPILVVELAADRIDELVGALRGLFRCSLPRDISGQRFIDDAAAVLARFPPPGGRDPESNRS